MHINLQMGVLPCLAPTDLLDAVPLEETTQQLVRVVPDVDSEGQYSGTGTSGPAPLPHRHHR